MELTVIGYKNENRPGCPSLENVLYHLAIHNLKATCTVTKYTEKNREYRNAPFPLEMVATEAIIVVDTPNERSQELVAYVKKQINLD